MRGRLITPLVALAVALLVAYGGILRVDAFVQKYGTLDHPGWARLITHIVVPIAPKLRPSAYRWYGVDRPYEGGDPINYLKFAREMRSFYQPHVREPVFLALTRVFLWLLDNQDAAVSFASIAGSLLAILGTYLLGAVMFSRSAGFAAALLLAIEYDVISWSVDGWRDDVFMATVVLSAWAFIRCRREATIANAVVLGTMLGAACLTRITALSFVLPGLVCLLLDGDRASRRQRARCAAAAALVCAVLVAPYLISCALATGDPLYAINYHTRYYRYGEGLPSEKPMSAAAYIGSKIAGRPLAALDTGITGLFVQPFVIKWIGYEGWVVGAGAALSWLALAGLLSWPFSANGRLLLVVLFSSMAPYALTWNVAGGGEWRFTMHAYPFYLVGTVSAMVLVWRGGRMLWRRPGGVREVPGRTWQKAAAGMAIVAFAYVAYMVLPWFVVREAIATGNDVSVQTGARDETFFGSGWSKPYVDGLTFRVSEAERSVIRIPLPSRRLYHIVLRLDPVAPDRQHKAVVLLNRQLLAILPLTWNPERVGTYPLQLPPDKVRVGINELTIVPDTLVAAGSAGARFAGRDPAALLGVRLWFVRVLAPPPAQATRSVQSEALISIEGLRPSIETTSHLINHCSCGSE
jgi:hypothetical protein